MTRSDHFIKPELDALALSKDPQVAALASFALKLRKELSDTGKQLDAARLAAAKAEQQVRGLASEIERLKQQLAAAASRP